MRFELGLKETQKAALRSSRLALKLPAHGREAALPSLTRSERGRLTGPLDLATEPAARVPSASLARLGRGESLVGGRHHRRMLLSHGGGHLGSGRNEFYRALKANAGFSTLAGLGAFLTSFLGLWCLRLGRPSRSSLKPPSTHELLSFACSFFLAGGRKQVGVDPPRARLRASFRLGVRLCRRSSIAPRWVLVVSVLRPIGPFKDGSGSTPRGRVTE